VSTSVNESKGAVAYWAAVNKVILALTGKTNDDWKQAVEETKVRLAEQAIEQIRFWQEKMEQYAAVDHETAVKLLVKALKIDSKIAEIKKLARLK
jgi:uncharacterized protein (DUF934 family)